MTPQEAIKLLVNAASQGTYNLPTAQLIMEAIRVVEAIKFQSSELNVEK